ncbi:MAG: peptidoglycan-binding domain-containing protein [Candidatus Aquicultorales bacterium]
MNLIGRGDRGDEVADLQRRLATLGYDIGPTGADGSFGDNTEQAVRRFQEDRSVEVTGSLTEETWRHLVEAGYSLGDRLLYLRTPFFRGDDVRRLQIYLNTLGFNTGIVDGIFGRTTEGAVREFQRNIGLVPDGIVGDSTTAAFKSLRNILEDPSSKVFPDPERTSAISAIVGRPVAVEAAEGVSEEIAQRFANLLEILGANVLFERVTMQPTAELLIGFDECQKIDEAVTVYEAESELEEMSKSLASGVQKELELSLNCPGDRIVPRYLGKGLPAIVVQAPREAEPADEVGQEIYRQKVAVAVFDAVKNFLESA